MQRLNHSGGADPAAIVERYDLDVDPEELFAVVADANSLLEVQQATRAPRTAVKPALGRLGLLEDLDDPASALIERRNGRRS